MSTLTLLNGTVLTRVSRALCLARVYVVALNSYEYSQTRVEQLTDKRADCTGWVSYVWDTPDAGPGIYLHAYNTASFYTQHVITRLDWADLLPGDVIGYCSPTSPGNGGHAAIWMGGDKRPDGTFDVSDHGSGWGPKRRHVKWDGISTGWLHPDHLAPWRYVAVIEDGQGGDMLTPDEIKAIADAVWNRDVLAGPDVKPAWQVLGETYRKVQTLTAAGMSGPVDLTAAAVAEIRDAVADLGEGGAAQVRTDQP